MIAERKIDMEILKLLNVKKYYGTKTNITKAVNDLSLQVTKGEFVAIMGASGSGKTTLLNCISTIDEVTSGHIYIGDKDITELKEKEFYFHKNLLLKPVFIKKRCIRNEYDSWNKGVIPARAQPLRHSDGGRP